MTLMNSPTAKPVLFYTKAKQHQQNLVNRWHVPDDFNNANFSNNNSSTSLYYWQQRSFGQNFCPQSNSFMLRQNNVKIDLKNLTDPEQQIITEAATPRQRLKLVKHHSKNTSDANRKSSGASATRKSHSKKRHTKKRRKMSTGAESPITSMCPETSSSPPQQAQTSFLQFLGLGEINRFAQGEDLIKVAPQKRGSKFFDSLFCCMRLRQHPNHNGHQRQPGPSSSHYSPKVCEKLLLPPIRPCDLNKKCLIVDLDETLVHSSFKPVKNPDFIIPVEIDGIVHQVYVLKRPNVEEFLEKIGSMFECILFTASLAKYADPVADLLDKKKVFRSRLFREACVFHRGNYVKDLNRLGRDLKRVVILDNSPASYAFHPENAVPIQSWFEDMTDKELLTILPLLEKLSKVDNVYSILQQQTVKSGTPQTAQITITNNININIINNNSVEDSIAQKSLEGASAAPKGPIDLDSVIMSVERASIGQAKMIR